MAVRGRGGSDELPEHFDLEIADQGQNLSVQTCMDAANCLGRKGGGELSVIAKLDECLERKHFGLGGCTAVLEKLEPSDVPGTVKLAKERMDDGQAFRLFNIASKAEPNVVVDHSAESSSKKLPDVSLP